MTEHATEHVDNNNNINNLFSEPDVLRELREDKDKNDLMIITKFKFKGTVIRNHLK